MEMNFDLGQQAETKLSQIIQTMEGGQPQLLGNIGSVLVTMVNEGFVSAQDPWGNIWKPLVIRKGQPLRDTGRLKGSINHQVRQNYVEVGTNLIYAPLQQFGATISPKQAKMLRFFNGSIPIFAKKVVIPARPYLPIDLSGNTHLPQAWEQAIVRNIQNFVEGAI